ncbi:unnamed protein product, partial [Cladocopium goreaui]
QWAMLQETKNGTDTSLQHAEAYVKIMVKSICFLKFGSEAPEPQATLQLQAETSCVLGPGIHDLAHPGPPCHFQIAMFLERQCGAKLLAGIVLSVTSRESWRAHEFRLQLLLEGTLRLASVIRTSPVSAWLLLSAGVVLSFWEMALFVALGFRVGCGNLSPRAVSFAHRRHEGLRGEAHDELHGVGDHHQRSRHGES